VEGWLTMNARPIERWVRRAAILILVGLAIEAITLRILHPLSFMAFATVGILALVGGIATFLFALLRSTEPRAGD
jgi:hypothetical protein